MPYQNRPMHQQFRPRPGSAPVDPYGMAPAVSQGVPQQPNVQANPLAPQVQRARPMPSRGGRMAEAAQQAEQARVSMGRDGIGALNVPTPTDEKNVGYGATAAPFVGMAAMFPPLAPVAAAFGAASLAEQYLSNKEQSRNPSELPREWGSYTNDMKNAWAMNKDPELAARMERNDATSSPSVSTKDIKNFEMMKRDDPKLTFTEYMTKYRHKAEGDTADIQNYKFNQNTLGSLIEYYESKAGATAKGGKEAEYLATRNEEMGKVVNDLEPKLAQAWTSTNELIKAFETGKYDAGGPVMGRVSKYFSGDMAGLEARAMSQALENLQITNLAPVTENEITMIRKMFASPEFRTEANIGILKEMLNRIQRQAELIRPQSDYYREKGSMEGYLPKASTPWKEGAGLDLANEPPVPGPATAAPPGPDPTTNPLLRPMP